jgi:hypothetical protein
MQDDILQVEGDATVEGSSAKALKVNLRRKIVLEVDNPCDAGSTTFDVELLRDCPDCNGRHETVWGTCTRCVQGLVPNTSGESVLFLFENFLQPTGFKRRGE